MKFSTTLSVSLLLVWGCGSLKKTVKTTKTPENQALFQTISRLDSVVFEAYNTCDVDGFQSFFTDDVEFYHDKGGLMTGTGPLREALKNNICGKVRRELVKSSLEVYPMDNYGAVEIGEHLFFHPPTKREDDEPGIAKFVHLWHLKDGAWKISRVISFDHQSLDKVDSRRQK